MNIVRRLRVFPLRSVYANLQRYSGPGSGKDNSKDPPKSKDPSKEQSKDQSKPKDQSESKDQSKSKDESTPKAMDVCKEQAKDQGKSPPPDQGKSAPPAKDQGKSPPQAKDVGKSPPQAKDQGKTPPQAKDQGKSPPQAKDQGKSPPQAKDQGKSPPQAQGKGPEKSQGTGGQKEGPKPIKVTMLKGEGVGPEIMDAVQEVLSAAEAPIEWEIFDECKSPDSDEVPAAILESLGRNKVGVKGPVDDRRWQRHIRKAFEQFAYVSICNNIEGVDTPFGEFDLVIIRDQMEGDYSGIEHKVVPGVMQTIKVSTKVGAERMAKFVFGYAREHNRKKITVAHKANIMRLTDGEFLDAIHAEADKHADKVLFEERYLDTTILNLLMKPEQNDVLVSSSMYGDVMRIMSGAMMGSPFLCPGYSVSCLGKVFECRMNSQPELASKDLVNPTGHLLSTVLMLRHLKLDKHADAVEGAVRRVYKESDVRTKDLGGCAKCSEFVQAVCDEIKCAKNE